MLLDEFVKDPGFSASMEAYQNSLSRTSYAIEKLAKATSENDKAGEEDYRALHREQYRSMLTNKNDLIGHVNRIFPELIVNLVVTEIDRSMKGSKILEAPEPRIEVVMPSKMDPNSKQGEIKEVTKDEFTRI
jgi:hypothetical protein